MNEIKLQREGLDEYIDGLEVGETCDIYATIKIVSKNDSEIVATVEDVEKSDMSMESDEEMEGDEEGYESEEEAPRPKKHGKGLGILIMMGGPKRSK
jgi:hypothetical protein